MSRRFREDLAAACAETIEKAEQGAPEAVDAHPDLDTLTAYHAGALTEARSEEIQDHLLRCRRCVEDLLELDDFVEAPQRAAAEPPRLDTAAAWRALRPRLFATGGWGPVRAMAASLLIVALGLGFWGIQQRRTAEELRQELMSASRPQPDVPIVDLWPQSVVRGEARAAVEVELGADIHYLAVVLNFPQALPGAVYTAVILDPQGSEISKHELRASPYGSLTLGLPRTFLPVPGESRIRLYLGDEPRGEPVEEFPLPLVPSGE